MKRVSWNVRGRGKNTRQVFSIAMRFKLPPFTSPIHACFWFRFFITPTILSTCSQLNSSKRKSCKCVFVQSEEFFISLKEDFWTAFSLHIASLLASTILCLHAFSWIRKLLTAPLPIVASGRQEKEDWATEEIKWMGHRRLWQWDKVAKEKHLILLLGKYLIAYLDFPRIDA